MLISKKVVLVYLDAYSWSYDHFSKKKYYSISFRYPYLKALVYIFTIRNTGHFILDSGFWTLGTRIYNDNIYF